MIPLTAEHCGLQQNFKIIYRQIKDHLHTSEASVKFHQGRFIYVTVHYMTFTGLTFSRLDFGGLRSKGQDYSDFTKCVLDFVHAIFWGGDLFKFGTNVHLNSWMNQTLLVKGQRSVWLWPHKKTQFCHCAHQISLTTWGILLKCGTIIHLFTGASQ